MFHRPHQSIGLLTFLLDSRTLYAISLQQLGEWISSQSVHS